MLRCATNAVSDLESKLSNYLLTVLNQLKATHPEIPSDIEPTLEIPKDPNHGELAAPVAMQLAKRCKLNPAQLAQEILDGLGKELEKDKLDWLFDKIELQSPGFINFHLSKSALYEVMRQILEKKEGFGRSNLGKGEKVQIEFVSANPTGPLTVAHGRQAAFGDSLANLLEFSGYSVKREYYINDEGIQINLLAESIKARCYEILGVSYEFPNDGYKGEYIKDLAKKLTAKHGKKLLKQAVSFFANFGVEEILNGIKKDLDDFGVHFDVWYSQKKLTKGGKITKALEFLRSKGYIYDKEGASWFKSSEFGDDKDRVVIKSDASLTYIASDIAYHSDKFRRGFKKLIDIWGPDHHGYIKRMEAAVEALGHEKGALCILLVQLATLFRSGQPISMSTRAGEFITLREVMDEVGKDAGRFFFLMRKRDSHLDFDLELAKKQSPENPVYYIQYGHARISSILEFEEKSKRLIKGAKLDPGLLNSAEEIILLKKLREFPNIVTSCAINLEVFALIVYLQELAALFHVFYTKHRVISDDLALSSARLALCDCIRLVISNGLELLGVSAPEKM